MTTITSQEDFLRALSENPQWREAVRAQILGEDVLQLPARFDAFVERTERFMERTEAFMADQVEFNRQQAEFNRQMLVRFDRMEGDIGNLKGFFAEYKVGQHARFVVRKVDEHLRYVRTVPSDEMEQMGDQAMSEGHLDRAGGLSFMEADLVIEATDGDGPCYLAVEVSYTGDRRDADRARRNANIISELKGCPARPVVASVRNVDEVDEDIQSGFLSWYQVSQQQMAR